MGRILRAFAWLRWRMLINSLERTGARDTIERFSIAIEKLGPIMAAVVLIPSGLLLAAGAAAAGFALARGSQHTILFDAARLLLLLIPVACIFGPLLLPAADRTNPVRMLLLPIPRRTLYAAQSASAFVDVWVVATLPIVLFLPLGLLVGGAPVAASLSLVAGLLLVLVIVGLTSLATSLLHLVVRDRRRGELLALLFIIVIPGVSMLPGLMNGLRHAQHGKPQPSIESKIPAWMKSAGASSLSIYPPEMYARATRQGALGELGVAATCVAGLAAATVVINALGMLAFVKVLDSPGSTGARRTVRTRAAWARKLPGLSRGASAVALAQLRLGLRTPRGRSIALSPMMITGVCLFVFRGRVGSDIGPFSFEGGIPIAAMASFVGLLAVLPIAMNQFAVDNAGLTLALLSPLTDREYLTGKAVGNGLIVAVPVVASLLLSLLVMPGGSPALWLSIPIATIATYFLVAPAAAVLSALFPRLVDLNSIGRGSNAHGLAAFLGMISFVAAAAPAILIAFAASALLHRPALAPALLAAWCAISYAISRLLFIPVRRIFNRRRENLAMLL